MKLTYIFHSGFAIEADKCNIIIDYYIDPTEEGKSIVFDNLLNSKKKLYVLSSHSHMDHFNPVILEWKQIHNNVQYIFSSDIFDEGLTKKENAIYLDKGDIYSDNHLNIQAFGSTDMGISFLIKCEGKTIFHAGDLNNWHWDEESTPEEIKASENAYLVELNELAQNVNYLDAAMFPVDPRLGKNYMKGAEQFVDAIKTGIFIPMHFREHSDKANEFRSYANKKGTRFFEIKNSGDSIEI